MADLGNISQVTLPNGDVAHFKDSTAIERLDNFALKDIHPVLSKTYTNVYCSANSDPAGWLYFGMIRPTDFQAQWSIAYRIHSVAAGRADAVQVSDIYISGMRDTYAAYRTWNEITNTSYSPLYAYAMYRCKEAGYNAGYGPVLGIRFQSAWNPHVAANSRTIDIEILELKNCTFTFWDSMILYADVPGTGSTNYGAREQFDGTTQGNTMSGDRNPTLHSVYLYYSRLQAGANGVKQYSLVMEDGDGKIQSFTTNHGAAATKTKNTSGFKLGGIWYYNGGGNPAANAYVGNYTIQTVDELVDLRYSFNLSGTNALLPGHIWVVGTMHSDGLFYLDDTWWTQTAPTTEDGKVYIYLGTVYFELNSSNVQTNAYRIAFYGWQGAYWFKNGRFQRVEESSFYAQNADTASNAANADKVNNHTVAKDVPSDAVFTDTTDLSQMTGTLGFAHGGTGQTNGQNAANALLNQLSTGSSTPTDADYYISQYVGGGTTTTTYHRRPMSAMWTWIKSKIDAAYANALTKYAGSDSAGGPANTVKGSAGTDNAYRHVWFSYNGNEPARSYDDDFKYNPATNSVKVSGAYVTYNSTTKSIDFTFD